MEINRLRFNFFLIKNLTLLYVLSVIINSIIFSSALVLINCLIHIIFSLSIFLLNINTIRNSRIKSYFAFSSINFLYLGFYLNKLFTKKTVTAWENVKGELIQYERTYYFYEINKGAVKFELVSFGIFLFCQLIIWYVMNKNKQFRIDLD